MNMRLPALFCIISIATAAWGASTTPLVVVSAASPTVGIAADSLASIFGDSISTQTVAAASTPWPTSLGDISVVLITDAGKQQRQAGILFVSPTQMNIYIPAGVAAGPATIAFPVTGLPPGVGTAALRTVSVNIARTAPGLFSADGTGTGVAAASGIRVTLPTLNQLPVAVFTCTLGSGCVAVPIDPGVDAPVYISLYGIGIRGASSLSNVVVNIGGVSVQPTYAGPQGQTPGLDQVNFVLPLALHGAGSVDLSVTVDGIQSNTVRLAVR